MFDLSLSCSWQGSAAAAEHELLSMLARDSPRRAPVLLLYADADPACGMSQALVAYHALRGRGSGNSADAASQPVPSSAQLVVYRGDTNALTLPAHRRDAARRTCAWLVRHMDGPAATHAL